MVFQPWRQTWQSGGSAWEVRFASLGWRDAETQLDPTLFRMYESRLYRFPLCGTDPVAGSILNPQSLNRYVPQSGMPNNPVNFIDPLGLNVCFVRERCVPGGGHNWRSRLAGSPLRLSIPNLKSGISAHRGAPVHRPSCRAEARRYTAGG